MHTITSVTTSMQICEYFVINSSEFVFITTANHTDDQLYYRPHFIWNTSAVSLQKNK